MADLVIDGVNVSKQVQSAFRGKLQQCNVWRDGVPRACDGVIQTSTVGGRATLIHSEFLDQIEQPRAGDELTVHGDNRRWRILSVSGTPGVSWVADVARGLKAGDDSYAPVPLAIAAFSTSVTLTVVPPAVLQRGHFLLIEWDGPSQGSLYTSRGAVSIAGLLPDSSYTMRETEFDGDGTPSTTQEFTARTTS